MKNEIKKTILLVVYLFVFIVPAISQKTDTLNIENFYRIRIGYIGPFARSIASFNPNSIRGANVPVKIYLENTSYMFDDIIKTLYLNSKREPSGQVYENQRSDAHLLFDFYYKRFQDTTNIIFSIFLKYDGTYLINESGIEYKSEKDMIVFLKKYFYFLYDSYLKIDQ